MDNRTQGDCLNPVVEHNTSVPAVGSITIGIGQRAIRIEVGDDVAVDIHEGEEPQPAPCRDAGDLVGVDNVVSIEVGREDERLALLHIKIVATGVRAVTPEAAGQFTPLRIDAVTQQDWRLCNRGRDTSLHDGRSNPLLKRFKEMPWRGRGIGRSFHELVPVRGLKLKSLR